MESENDDDASELSENDCDVAVSLRDSDEVELKLAVPSMDHEEESLNDDVNGVDADCEVEVVGLTLML